MKPNRVQHRLGHREAVRSRPLSRSALAGFLFVVGTLFVPFALLGIWTQRVLLDRDHFTALADDFLRRDAVRRGLADELLTQAERREAGVAEHRGQLEPAITDALATAPFRGVFTGALSHLHDQLSAGDQTLTLDLSPGVSLVRLQVAAADPSAARSFPSDSKLGVITIARRDEVPVLWGAAEAARRTAILTPLLALAAFVAAAVVSRRPLRTIAFAGAVIAAVALLLVAGMDGVQSLIGNRVRAVDRAAFDASWDVVEHSFVTQALVVAAGGAIVAAAALVVQLVVSARRPRI